MLPSQLKETTMDPKKRTLLQVAIDETPEIGTADAVDALMGNRPDLRFRFIQDRAAFAVDLDV